MLNGTSVMEKETKKAEKIASVALTAAEPKFQINADFMSFKKLFKALASDERIEILRLLKKNGEMFAQDIEKHFYMEQSTASHHLNTLLRAGAVTNRKSGRYIYYALQKDSISKMLDEFIGLL